MEEKLDRKSTLLWTIWNYVEAAVLVIAGILAIVFRDEGAWQASFAYAIGAFVILDGLLRVTMAILTNEKSETSIMLLSGFEIALGIFLIIREAEQVGFFVGIAIEFLSIFLIVLGALFLAFSIVTIALKRTAKLMMPILEIVFAAVLIGVGLTLLILYKNGDPIMKAVVMITMGIIVIIVGVAIAVITTITRVKKQKEFNLHYTPMVENKKGKKEEKAPSDKKKEKPEALEHKEGEEKKEVVEPEILDAKEENKDAE